MSPPLCPISARRTGRPAARCHKRSLRAAKPCTASGAASQKCFLNHAAPFAPRPAPPSLLRSTTGLGARWGQWGPREIDEGRRENDPEVPERGGGDRLKTRPGSASKTSDLDESAQTQIFNVAEIAAPNASGQPALPLGRLRSGSRDPAPPRQKALCTPTLVQIQALKPVLLRSKNPDLTDTTNCARRSPEHKRCACACRTCKEGCKLRAAAIRSRDEGEGCKDLKPIIARPKAALGWAIMGCRSSKPFG